MNATIDMYGLQTFSFLAIDPLTPDFNGRVTDLIGWMNYWNNLVTTPLQRVSLSYRPLTKDCLKNYMDSFFASVFQCDRLLILTVDAKRYVIERVYNEDFLYHVHYEHHNSWKWIHQGGSYGFNDPYEMLRHLRVAVGKDTWGNLPSEFLISY